MSEPRNSPGLGTGRPAVGYLRRSTDRQDQSVGDQRRAIENYAERHDFEIRHWYTDDAISGASVEARDGFRAMMAAAREPNRPWRHILVFDVSRFSRGDLDEAGFLRHQLRQAGVEVVYCSENFAGTDADDLVLGVKQWQARQFVKDLSRVTIRGQLSHSEGGWWCGGTPPFGYDLLYHDSGQRPYQRVRWLETGQKEVYDADGHLLRVLPCGERLSTSKSDKARLVLSTPQRVELVRRIFRESVEEARGFRTIANGLNCDGISSPRDGNWSKNARAQWSVGTIRSVLRNPAYMGDTVWNRRTFAKFHRVRAGTAVERPRVDADKPRENAPGDWIVVSNTHEPIVSPALFDRAQELMKARGRNAGPGSFRAGSGLRSPFLLSGLISCARCEHAYQGRTTNSTKRRKDGTKIQTRYYCCGGHVMKGNATCERLLLRKDPLEEYMTSMIAERVQALLAGEGEALLREYIAEEIAAQGQDPGREMAAIRARLAEIDRKADILLEGLTPETRGFVDTKLRDLAAEKRRLQAHLEELDALPYQPIDADAVLRDGLAALQDLPRLMEAGSLEERKEFIRAFITGITVHPDEQRLEVQMRKLPATALPRPGDSSVGVVAGAGCDRVQTGVMVQTVQIQGHGLAALRAA